MAAETILERFRRIGNSLTTSDISDANANYYISDAQQWYMRETDTSSFTEDDDTDADIAVSFWAIGQFIKFSANPEIKYYSIGDVRISKFEDENWFHKQAKQIVFNMNLSDYYYRDEYDVDDSKWDENIDISTTHTLPTNVDGV